MTKRSPDELRIGTRSGEPPAGSETELDRAMSRTVRGSRAWRTIAWRSAAPVLAALALALVLFGSRRDTDFDLQLVAPLSVEAGGTLPLRTLLYENLRGFEGPRLRAQPVDVQLVDPRGRVVATTTLAPSRADVGDSEGALSVPAGAQGRFRLRAVSRIEEDVRVEASRVLRVGEVDPLLVEERPLRALQQYSAGPLQPVAGEMPPDVVRVRVAGGACVPEEECRVLVHVGSPAAAPWIEANSTVTPSVAAARPAHETAGVVALSVVTHGPEAQLWLRLSRDGRPVARRAVRLPIAQAAGQLRPTSQLLRAPAVPELRLHGGEGGCIVDVFGRGRWLRTGSAASCSAPFTPPIAALGPGVYRIQARRDPFAGTAAAVALAYVTAPHETPASALRALARAVLAVDPTDRFARAALASPDAELQLDAAAFAYLAAVLESGLIALPPAVSDYADSLERLARSQAELRWLSIVALVLGGVSLVLAVGRSGLAAAARADTILLEAGQTGSVRRRARARAMLSLALSVLSLVLVFVVVGAYVVARSAP